MVLQVWARDGGRVRRGTLTTITGKVLLRRTAVGGWTMEFDGTKGAASSFERGWGIIVLEDGKFIFSGPATKIRREFSGGGHTLVLEGETDMHVLKDRDVYPNPAAGSGDQKTVTHYAATGVAETLIVNLINSQVSSSAAQSFRATANMPALTSLGRGASTSIAARWTKVLDEVQALASVGGLVVDIGQSSPGSPNLVTTIRVPVDRSRSVRFTPETGLGDYSVELVEPTATVSAVGGAGEGTARLVVGVTLNSTWGNRRREIFIDRRDTNVTADLTKTARETAAETAEQATASFRITESARYQYGTDFLLGDLVSVYPGAGEIITAPVTSAEFTWDGHGRTVELGLGENAAGTGSVPLAIERIRRLERRLSRMEGGQ